MNEALDLEMKKIRKCIVNAIEDDDLKEIFNDLIWAIIKYKQDDFGGSLMNLGRFIDGTYAFLFNSLHPLTQVNYTKIVNKNAFYFHELHDSIFDNLNLRNKKVLSKTREIYQERSNYEHRNIHTYQYDENYFLYSIKLFLLSEKLNRSLKILKLSTIEIKTLSLNINNEFPELFRKHHTKTLSFFLKQISFRTIRQSIFSKGIINSKDVENLTFLQNLFPFVLLKEWDITDILNSKDVIPFRPDGPHLIDFESNNWVYIPKLSHQLIHNLTNKRQSLLLEGESGTGKTVISRYIGYKLWKTKMNIFYINCLDEKPKKIHKILDHLIINLEKIKNDEDHLVIFENIHIMRDSIKKFKIIKDNSLCLITRRIFKTDNNEDEDISNIFAHGEIFNLNKDSNNYMEAINGILRLNNVSDNTIKHLLSSVIFDNLWILGIFLKLTLKKDDKNSFFDILTDFEKLEEEFTTYFRNLMKSKHLKYVSADEYIFINHLKCFLSIVSIFSDMEIWVEDTFIYDFLSYNDDPLIQDLEVNLSYDKNILKKIISFLIDILEIQVRDSKSKKGLLQKEYKIPHSQIAKIYKNSFLSIFEENYSGFTNKIKNHYVFKGKYFGSFLFSQKRLIYSIFSEDYKEAGRTLVEKFNKFYAMLEDRNSALYYPEGLKLIRNQILENTLEEVQLFLDALPYNVRYNHDQKNVLYEKIFKLIFNEETLFDQKWNKKLIKSDFKGIYYFIREILDFLDYDMFERFLSQFSEQIIEKFKQSDEILLLNLIFLLLDSSEEVFEKYCESLVDSWSGKGLNFERFISLDGRARQRLLKIDKNHPKYEVLKSLILESYSVSTIKEDLKFFSKEDENILFIEVYFEFLTSSSNKLFIKNKVDDADLRDYTNLLTTLHEIDPNLSKNIFNYYHQKLREKIRDADWWIFSDFLSELQFLDLNKDLLEGILIKDWDWFINVLNKFPYEDFQFCSSKLQPFFKNYFPKYYERYKVAESKILKKKMKAEYDRLSNKEDIIQLVDDRRFNSEINDFLLNLFIDSLFYKIEELDLDYFIQIFKIFSGYDREIVISKKFILENLSLKETLSDKRFKNLIEEGSNENVIEIFNLVKIFKGGDKIFYEINQHLLLRRFGPNFVELLNYNEIGRQLFNELPSYIQNLDLEKIILIFNSTLEIPEDKLYLKLNALIRESTNLFLGENFKEKVLKFPASALLNFLIIIDLYHPDLFIQIKNKFGNLLYTIFKSNVIKIENILGLFIMLNINSTYFKKLDLKLSSEPVLFPKVQKSFQDLDLFSLRYIINFFIDHNIYDKISNFIDLLDIKVTIDNSSLLEFSLGSFAFLMNVLTEEAKTSPRYVNDYNFIIVSDKEYDRLTRYVDYLMIKNYRPKKKLKRFMVSGYSRTEIEIILEKIKPFSMKILNKMGSSTLTEIFFYIQSIISLKRIFRNKIFNPPTQFYDFFFSSYFSDLLSRDFSFRIYEFFQSFQLLDNFKTKELWIKNQSVLECKAFFKEYRLFKIIELLFMVYREKINSIPLKTTRLLKKRIIEIGFPGLMKLFQRLEFKKLDFALAILDDEIHKIVHKLSKYDLLEEFEPKGSYFLFKHMYADKFNLIKERIPIIKRKFEEKYIHE